MFMAGCYDCFDGQDQFVILTTEANPSVKPVHDRMPLILERSELERLGDRRQRRGIFSSQNAGTAGERSRI